MNRDKSVLSSEAYESVARKVRESGGSATSAGEQRHKEGKGLHPMVDPAGNGVIRRSITRFVEDEGRFIAPMGIAMPVETEFDTTGSMGGNIDLAFTALPRTYRLLTAGSKPVLDRYDLQMATAIFNDVTDNYVLARTQFEMDEKIAEQMTYLVPERQGDDTPEDAHYGLFGAAYLTAAAINEYGLKGYHFHIGDATSHPSLLQDQLLRIFGKDVFEKCAENNCPVDQHKLPSIKEVVKDLLKKSHAFFLQVGTTSSTTHFWSEIYGSERVVMLPSVELVPEIQAAIIGLTEGLWSLQDMRSHLVSECSVSEKDAKAIADAVSGIPIAAQAKLPNFDKIPAKGSVFASKYDLWPIVSDTVHEEKQKKSGWL